MDTSRSFARQNAIHNTACGVETPTGEGEMPCIQARSLRGKLQKQIIRPKSNSAKKQQNAKHFTRLGGL
jgi:hypothetical protein